MEIYEIKDYGKIIIKLKEIMKKKNITKNKLSKLIGSDNNLVNRYYNSEIERVDLDILARMCYVLDCDIKDILEYRENGEE